MIATDRGTEDTGGYWWALLDYYIQLPNRIWQQVLTITRNVEHFPAIFQLTQYEKRGLPYNTIQLNIARLKNNEIPSNNYAIRRHLCVHNVQYYRLRLYQISFQRVIPSPCFWLLTCKQCWSFVRLWVVMASGFSRFCEAVSAWLSGVVTLTSGVREVNSSSTRVVANLNI